MSAAIHLAKPDDLDKVLALVAAFHDEMEITSSDDSRRDAIFPLLDGIPYGAVYLVGPTRAPIGYIVVTFSWSIEYGGMDGFVDELYVRPPVRGRGIATEVLLALPKTLAEAGIKALHLEVDREDENAQRLYTRARFKASDRYILMTKEL
jgi:ribosomal protein S18 acetylase RimI-like enzyme